jgi:polysaccharide biosynthesis/export protein
MLLKRKLIDTAPRIWPGIILNRTGFVFTALLIALSGAPLFLGGCGGTPEPEADPEALDSGSFFYSRPDEAAGAEAEAGETAEPVPEGESYLINPHDLLDISVLGESDLSLTVRVSERGLISFPLLGEVRAAGYSPLQLERQLEELLGADFLVSPSVNVTVKESGTISVLGQVNKPGAFEIKGRLTVTRAIAQAGGLTSTASPNRTRLIRRYDGREETITIRLNDILKDGDLAHDLPLRPGDLIVVPESFF